MDEMTIQAVQWLALVTGSLLVLVAATLFANWMMGWADRHPIRKEAVEVQEDPLLSLLRTGDLKGLPELEPAVPNGKEAPARTHQPAA